MLYLMFISTHKVLKETFIVETIHKVLKEIFGVINVYIYKNIGHVVLNVYIYTYGFERKIWSPCSNSPIL